MALQAYVDDSLERGRVLVLAGYISTAENWSRFSGEWEHALTMTPRMTRFKMSEVNIRNDRQMDRLRYLHRIIEDHVLAHVAVAVNCEELTKWVSAMDVPKYLSNPYLLAHKTIVNLTAQIQREAGLTDRIDFIFDERSEKHHILGGFEYYMRTLPKEFADVTGSTPIFRKDDEFYPLQAADLLAWWTRKLWLKHGNIGQYVEYPWPMTKPIPAMVLDLAGDELLRLLKGIESDNPKKTRSAYGMSIILEGGVYRLKPTTGASRPS